MDVSVKNLMFDLAGNRKIYADDREISLEEANEKIREVCFSKLGLTKNATTRDINRALKRDSVHELFEVIEEVLDSYITTGWRNTEFFDDYVDEKNLADGDENEFYVEDNAVLTVEKVAGSHHDLIIQKLGVGETFDVPMSTYAVKVGSDLRLFLTGKKDWNQFIDAVAKAFINQIKNSLYTEFMNAGSKMPSSAQFNKTGVLGDATKDTFDTLIEDVQTANDNSPVMIMGTKTALKKINNIADVDWISNDQKDAYANTGYMGTYEGTVLFEIPQRFKGNDTAIKLVDSNKLLIMPMVENKFVKFVDSGETEFTTPDDHKTRDDLQTYEVQRRMGIAAIITRIFGTWAFE